MTDRVRIQYYLETAYQFQLGWPIQAVPTPEACRMASSCRTFLALTLLLGALTLPQWAAGTAEAAEKLVVYSGRAERLIKPVLDEFQAKSGIQI